jgi:hypothetical protein
VVKTHSSVERRILTLSFSRYNQAGEVFVLESLEYVVVPRMSSGRGPRSYREQAIRRL